MEADLLKERMPRHVAIIMDGNGRWAKARGQARPQGHLEGVKRVDEIVSAAKDLGIEVLTLYTFSTENWLRPATEVSMLMQTLVAVIAQKLAKLHENNIRFRISGRREGVPSPVLATFDKAIIHTQNNTGLTLNLAFNYGSRQEILDAVQSLAGRCVAGVLQPEGITEDVFSSSLYTAGLPDPDLLIRTSGEMRISNFLLWQLSYSEFYFTEKFWPEFTVAQFHSAVRDYQLRERRFGKVQAVRGRQT